MNWLRSLQCDWSRSFIKVKVKFSTNEYGHALEHCNLQIHRGNKNTHVTPCRLQSRISHGRVLASQPWGLIIGPCSGVKPKTFDINSNYFFAKHLALEAEELWVFQIWPWKWRYHPTVGVGSINGLHCYGLECIVCNTSSAAGDITVWVENSLMGCNMMHRWKNLIMILQCS